MSVSMDQFDNKKHTKGWNWYSLVLIKVSGRLRTRTARHSPGAKGLTGWAISRNYYTFQYLKKTVCTVWIGFGIESCTQQSFLKICKNSAWSFSFSKRFAVNWIKLPIQFDSEWNFPFYNIMCIKNVRCITFQVHHAVKVYLYKTAFLYYITISQIAIRRPASTK